MKDQVGGSSMYKSDEGMGLSVAIYAIAMVCGLALFVLPVVWANSPTVYENPGVSALRLPGGPTYATRRTEFPIANLKSQQIVSPEMLAELDAKAKKEKPVRRASSSSTTHRYAQADHDAPAEQRPARRPSLFSFFF
jgi:hypothetical protein